MNAAPTIELNNQQMVAVHADDAKLLVVAVPGSGKTRVLTERVKRLATVRDHTKFCVISFTNAAAGEMAKRLDSSGYVKVGFIGTCHSFAFKIMQNFGSLIGYRAGITIQDEVESKELLTTVVNDLRRAMNVDDLFKRMRVMENLSPDERLVYKEYRFRMLQSNSVDYDRMLTECVVLMKRDEVQEWLKRFTDLFVDEYQDTSPEEAEIHELMPCQNKFFVGDPDQAIYGFRGASIENIIRLSKSAVNLSLPRNYRSVHNICLAATSLIHHNRKRLPVEILADNREDGDIGRRSFSNSNDELNSVANWVNELALDGGTVAVLCRTNDIKYQFRQRLGIRGNTEEQRVPQEALQYVKILVDPTNDAHAERFLKARMGNLLEKAKATALRSEQPLALIAGLVPMDFKESRSFEDVPAWMGRYGKLPFATCDMIGKALKEYMDLESARSLGGFLAFLYDQRAPEAKKGAKITVCTVHGAKGLEWDHVAIVACEKECWERYNGGDDLEAERRLFYVGITRARQTLLLTSSMIRDTKWKKNQPRNRSQFLSEI